MLVCYPSSLTILSLINFGRSEPPTLKRALPEKL